MKEKMSRIEIFGMPVLVLILFTSCKYFKENRLGEAKCNKNIIHNSSNYIPSNPSNYIPSNPSNYIPSNPSKDGYIPNEKTAIKVAEAIWMPIYGEKDVLEHRPYNAKLKDGNVWIVSGTIYTRKEGSPFAIIQKSDGKILDVYHEE
jgi:hypothetical protein